ncbi:hypothetical protein [Pedobacter frigoris]|uniref:DUF4242 domain-containing protein n=1 Tax=Pedobacter frigoris TaxID=2571272 RepID=A0A4V5NY94_9SPHI|nr:hypothetical protein [Pedobacter frigoris]TKC02778.1 hypothetical protein FA047_20240 [Pedobacter frigoris]
MENFPELNDSQVVLLRADVNTGHILDEEFNLAINEHQKVFTLFDAAEAALLFAKEILSKNPKVECVIYKKGRTMLYHITPENVHL